MEEGGWRREGGGGKQSRKESEEMKTKRGVEEWKRMRLVNLIPRPFLPPRLQYAKVEEKA